MSYLKRLTRSIVSAIMCLCVVMTMVTEARAAAVRYYVQGTVDTTTWLFMASVIDDDSGAQAVAREAKLVSDQHLEFLRQGQALDLRLGNGMPGGNISSSLVLTFPSAITAKAPSAADRERARLVIDKCFGDLNRLITITYPDRSAWDIDVFCDHITQLMSYASDGGAHELALGEGAIVSISPCDLAANSPEFLSLRLDKSVLPSDYVRVDANSSSTYLLWRIPKGYSPVEGRDMPTGLADSTNEPLYITWNTLALEAVHNYSLRGAYQITPENVSATSSPYAENLRAIIDILANSLRSVLNLWTIDELVFCAGGRNSNEFLYGMFPVSWEPYIWMMYGIFALLSVLFLMFSLIRLVTSRALATANAMGRRKAWESVRGVITAILFFAALPFVIQLLCSASAGLAGIARALMGSDTVAMRRANVNAGGGLGGAVISVLTFATDVYFNFFYSLRMLSIAVMIAIAPICVLAYSFDSKKNQIFAAWTKEMLSAIFILPIHAFLLAFLCLLPTGGSGVLAILLMYSVIPLTSSLRSILFGDAGAVVDEQASSAARTVVNAIWGVRHAVAHTVFPITSFVVSGVARRLRISREWKTIEEGSEQKTEYEGVILKESKTGYKVLSGSSEVYVPKKAAEAVAATGVRFSPTSKSGLQYFTPEALQERQIRFRIDDVDREKGRIRGSANIIEKEKFMESLEPGQMYNGIVKKATDKGVLVNIGCDVTGYVPKRDFANPGVMNACREGSILPVYVRAIDRDTGRIGLSTRQSDPWAEDPWGMFSETFKKGDVTEARIIAVKDGGAIAAIADGVTGFIPNKFSDPGSRAHTNGQIRKGDRVIVAIRNIDEENQRILLSERSEDVSGFVRADFVPNGYDEIKSTAPVSPVKFWTSSDREAFETEHGRAPTYDEVALYARDAKVFGSLEDPVHDYDSFKDLVNNRISDAAFDISKVADSEFDTEFGDELYQAATAPYVPEELGFDFDAVFPPDYEPNLPISFSDDVEPVDVPITFPGDVVPEDEWIPEFLGEDAGNSAMPMKNTDLDAD